MANNMDMNAAQYHSYDADSDHQDVYLCLRKLTLKDFRCHQQGSWSFSEGVHILIGENGCGKTSVLEAISLMAHGRSFRQGRDPALVRWDCLNFEVGGTWHRYGPLHIELQGKRNKMQAKLQGQRVAIRKDLTEILPLVVDAPQARSLIDGATADRRRWLDRLTVACETGMQQHQRACLRVLMQRTRLLRRSASANELEAWESQLVQHGRQWILARQRICEVLNRALLLEQSLTESQIQVNIKVTAPEDDSLWLQKLAEAREDDRRLGRCRIGPHCDRILIEANGREIRQIGSRGQQKLASTAIKLAECAVRQQYRGVWPLLLLDDCLEALDPKRQQRLFARLCAFPGQIMVTAPGGVNIPDDLPLNCIYL